jgi:hypothetical protein
MGRLTLVGIYTPTEGEERKNRRILYELQIHLIAVQKTATTTSEQEILMHE